MNKVPPERQEILQTTDRAIPTYSEKLKMKRDEYVQKKAQEKLADDADNLMKDQYDSQGNELPKKKKKKKKKKDRKRRHQEQNQPDFEDDHSTYESTS